MQVGEWMNDKEVTNYGRAASWRVDVSMAGQQVTNDGRVRNECSMWSDRSCLNNEELCRWFDFMAVGGEVKFCRQASLHVLVWQVSTTQLSLNGARFVIIRLIIFEHRSIMWFICFDAWWWRILSTHGRAAGDQCLSISNSWPKFASSGLQWVQQGDLDDQVWILAKSWRHLWLHVLVWAGIQHGVVIQWSQVSDDLVDHAWTIKNTMWLICFDAWWWRVLSMHGRAAGYQCLSIILHSLICLLMSESVCGRPSFMHVDAWNGVWRGRSFTKAGQITSFGLGMCNLWGWVLKQNQAEKQL